MCVCVCVRERERENLTIERWVCACFYTCFIVVLSRSRSNGFRLVLPISKVWVFNVLLISSHWLLHLIAKEILSGAPGFLQVYQMLMAAQQHTWGTGMATWSFGWSTITRGIGSLWRIWSFYFFSNCINFYFLPCFRAAWIGYIYCICLNLSIAPLSFTSKKKKKYPNFQAAWTGYIH